MNLKNPLLIGIAAVLIGIGLGGATAETRSVTETVEITPESCIRALDTASEGFRLIGKGIEAALALDLELAEELLAELEALDVGPDVAQCRAKAAR